MTNEMPAWAAELARRVTTEVREKAVNEARRRAVSARKKARQDAAKVSRAERRGRERTEHVETRGYLLNKPTWDDFQRRPRDYDSEDNAYTKTTIDPDVDIEEGKVKSINVLAKFNKDESWVREGAETQLLLDHEQGHFDIARVHAVELKKTLSKFEGKPVEDVRNNIDEAVDRILSRMQSVQEDYEEETKKGEEAGKREGEIIESEQRKWDRMIRRSLKAGEWQY